LLLIQAYYENQQFDLAKILIQNIQDKYYSGDEERDKYYQTLENFKAE